MDPLSRPDRPAPPCLHRRNLDQDQPHGHCPISAEAFKIHARAELVKTLKPDDVVVLDNLNSHKGKAPRAMVKAIGARLFFLPFYSPDPNPVERAFAKISTRCERPWAEALRPSNAPSPKPSTPSHQECANYLANAGYKST